MPRLIQYIVNLRKMARDIRNKEELYRLAEQSSRITINIVENDLKQFPSLTRSDSDQNSNTNLPDITLAAGDKDIKMPTGSSSAPPVKMPDSSYKLYQKKVYPNSDGEPMGITLKGKTSLFINAHGVIKDKFEKEGKAKRELVVEKGKAPASPPTVACAIQVSVRYPGERALSR